MFPRKFAAALTILSLFATVLPAWAEDAANQPAVATPVTMKSEPTMRFHFVNAPVSDILTEMGRRLGFQIVQTAAVEGNVTVEVPQEVTAEEAVRLLNSVLIPMHLAAVDDSIELPSTTIHILRVMPIKEAMQFSPVGEVRTGG